jgi:hypothetical protein
MKLRRKGFSETSVPPLAPSPNPKKSSVVAPALPLMLAAISWPSPPSSFGNMCGIFPPNQRQAYDMARAGIKVGVREPLALDCAHRTAFPFSRLPRSQIAIGLR